MNRKLDNVALLGSEFEIDPREVIASGASVRGKYVRVYSFAHEGRAAALVDRVKRTFAVPLGAVKSALAAVVSNAPAMPLHEPGRADPLSHEGRKVLARVVGKALKKIGGKYRALVALAFDREEDARAYPKISLEARGFHIRNSVLRNVERVTGFGLLPLEGFEPGFPESGAESGVALCAFEDGGTDDMETSKRIAALEEELKNLKTTGAKKLEITLKDVKDYIAEHPEMTPTALGFTTDAILGEFEVKDGKLVFDGGDSRVTRLIQKKLNGAVLVSEEEAKAAREKAEAYEKQKGHYEALSKKELAEKLKSGIDAELKKRGAADPEKVKKYLLAPSRLGKLQSTGDPDKDLADYLTTGLEDYKADVVDAGSADDASSSGKPDGPDKSEIDLIKNTDLSKI